MGNTQGEIRMEGIGWQEQNELFEFVNNLDMISEDSYTWVTKIDDDYSWVSDKTRVAFGLHDSCTFDMEHRLLDYVHPHDKKEYIEGITKKLADEELTKDDFCIRIRTEQKDFCMYSFHTNPLRNSEGKMEYLVISIRNENVFRNFDPLTDLFTESKYVSDLAEIVTHYNKVAILEIHIEGFDTINLVYGRDYSNILLQDIAMQFIYMMDENKAVYHLDRERFIFILKNAERTELLEFEGKLRRTLSTRIMSDGTLRSIKLASGGILLDNYRADISSLCGQVTYALNHSITDHQGQLVIFNDEVKTNRGVDLALMKVIHQSVQNRCKGFYVEYQPIVDSQTGRVKGAEALIRWESEPYGNVPPGMFIDWLEKDPSMYELGNFVLRKALSEVKPILDIDPDFFINVNISIRQLERKEFRTAVLNILDQTGFPPTRLCMELTERCKDLPPKLLDNEVRFFQAMGVRMAIDDYGTGSASSNLVLKVPMDELKIDMSFIHDIMDNPRNQAMVRSILYFAKSAGMYTCLEGVETKELQDYLRDYGATWFQGYYYSKPIRIDKLTDYVMSSREE